MRGRCASLRESDMRSSSSLSYAGSGRSTMVPMSSHAFAALLLV